MSRVWRGGGGAGGGGRCVYSAEVPARAAGLNEAVCPTTSQPLHVYKTALWRIPVNLAALTDTGCSGNYRITGNVWISRMFR